MGTLARRSALVLALLFGLVFAVGTAVMWYLGLSIWFAIAFAVGMVTLQYAVSPWLIDRIFQIRWSRPEELSSDFATWYRQTCAELKITPPRWGIIEDGNPNAFTYGRTRGDARVVITSGLVTVLNEDELRAVVAHEFGHVAHRDFIVMTVAQSVPLLLYILYVWTRDRARDGAYAIAVAAGAYAAYIASQFIVLLLSRVREYFADTQAAHTTHNPDALASALVKISYGLAPRHDKVMAAQAAEADEKDKKSKDKGSSPWQSGTATAALGIANLSAASTWAMNAADASGTFSIEAMNRAAQWEFKNPWAKWFEWNSTHPLTARRIQSLNHISHEFEQSSAYEVHEDTRTYSGSFAFEFFLYSLPLIGGLGGWWLGQVLTQSFIEAIAWTLIGGSMGTLIYTARAYPRGDASLRTVSSLVGDELDVSHVNALPCAVEGTIIGRGVPGLFWSDDLVLRDETGHITLQYRQPFVILEFLWGWIKAARYQGREARVYGWYRRAPIPYVEISHIEMLDGDGDNVRCYYRWGTVALSLLGTLAGIGLILWF
jgi:heat shock protein HtpX